MHHVISDISDVSLELYRDVTRHRGTAELSADLRERIDTRRQQFLDCVTQNRDAHLYGITTRHHVGAKTVLDDYSLDEYSTRMPASGSSFGPALPERVVRGIVITRLADFVNGTGCLRAETVGRILDMLHDEQLPSVPQRGCGEPGDIIPLGYLFRARFNGSLELGEGMAMINGSPVAAAALADAAVEGSRRPDVLELVFALAAFAISAPLQHFDATFEQRWNDEYIARSLGNIRGHLEGADNIVRLAYQAPVSFRSTPRMLGWLRRTQATTEELARTALRTSSNNPAFVGPDVAPPYGTVLSNGGYHSPYASPALDALARSWADVAQIFTALNNQVTEMPGGLLGLEGESEVSTLYHVSSGWAEEARAAATSSLLSLGNGGQTDTGTLDLLAWRKATEAGDALDCVATVLAVSSAHLATHKGLSAAGRLAQFHEDILRVFPIGTKPVEFADRLAQVREILTTGDTVASTVAVS